MPILTFNLILLKILSCFQNIFQTKSVTIIQYMGLGDTWRIELFIKEVMYLPAQNPVVCTWALISGANLVYRYLQHSMQWFIAMHSIIFLVTMVPLLSYNMK